MSDPINDLERLARAATPGPWYMDVEGHQPSPFKRYEDAQFVAAANPAAVLALLERLQRAEAALLEQWEANHEEHCYSACVGDGDRCYWPKPAALAGRAGA